MLVFFTFFTLLALIVIRNRQLNFLHEKTSEDWILDTLGLLFQGIVIPLLQLGIIYQLYQKFGVASLRDDMGFILKFQSNLIKPIN